MRTTYKDIGDLPSVAIPIPVIYFRGFPHRFLRRSYRHSSVSRAVGLLRGSVLHYASAVSHQALRIPKPKVVTGVKKHPRRSAFMVIWPTRNPFCKDPLPLVSVFANPRRTLHALPSRSVKKPPAFPTHPNAPICTL